ncbi:MAG: histidine ammonia-lyase [Myxococcales bacterium]
MRIVLSGSALKLEDVAAAAAGGVRVEVAAEARERVRAARRLVDEIARGDVPTYGINTGFGTLAEVSIPRAELQRLQRNLILSHSAGTGEPLPLPEVRALMLLRANVLCGGYSGIRESTLDLLVSMLERDVIPVVPEKGSVGASGDLAPLAHLALVLIGEGEAFFKGARLPGREALSRAGLQPVVLEAKEGLALVNGTQAMQAVGALALLEAERCARIADIAASMTVEGLMGSHKPFLAAIHRVRGHEGQSRVAADLRALLARSEINASHQDEHCGKVQDPYSLRCVPQVHGAARDALSFVRRTLEIEANAATDNPLVFAAALDDVAEGTIVSGGNFHGQPVSQALDLLAIACTQLQTISERRVEQLVNPSLSGLPPFLARNSGLNSGFMIAQVTAAALAAESKVLSHPACVDTIPSSAGREDHVSMGMTAAWKARTVVANAASGLAIELLVAAQALDLRKPLRAGVGAQAALAAIRGRVSHMEEDREIHRDIAVVRSMLPEIEAAARSAAGLREPQERNGTER